MPLIVGCVVTLISVTYVDQPVLLLLSVGSLQNGHSEDSLNSLEEHYNSDDQLDIRITDHTLDQVRHFFLSFLSLRGVYKDSLRTLVVTNSIFPFLPFNLHTYYSSFNNEIS